MFDGDFDPWWSLDLTLIINVENCIAFSKLFLVPISWRAKDVTDEKAQAKTHAHPW